MVQSLYAMPIIVINMGGEMIYILNQRLKAQSVPDDKAEKVMLDVLKAMYTSVFVDVRILFTSKFSNNIVTSIFIILGTIQTSKNVYYGINEGHI